MSAYGETCKFCKRYDTSPAYERGEGFCDLELPPWMVITFKNDEFRIQLVKEADSCSFWEPA